MKASDLFIRCLENEGVEYIFGSPGEENFDVMDSMIDSKIKFITIRHEHGAAFMADAEVGHSRRNSGAVRLSG